MPSPLTIGGPDTWMNGSAAGGRRTNFRPRWSDIAPACWVLLRDWPPGPISGWQGLESFVLKPNGRWLSGGVAAEGRMQSSCCTPKSCDPPPPARPDAKSFRAARVTGIGRRPGVRRSRRIRPREVIMENKQLMRRSLLKTAALATTALTVPFVHGAFAAG